MAVCFTGGNRVAGLVRSRGGTCGRRLRWGLAMSTYMEDEGTEEAEPNRVFTVEMKRLRERMRELNAGRDASSDPEDVMWEEEPPLDIEGELERELEDLASELGFESGDELVDWVQVPRPENPLDVINNESEPLHPEAESPMEYKTWTLDPLMSSEQTALPLDEPVFVDGIVVEGFGRGSAQLGFPTANVDAAVLGVTIAAQENGVYYGWARLDNGPRVHGAVLNIGYNPTFGDVKKRMLEAYLTSDFGEDFYGARLRLLIVGFLRKERKFDSFPELVRNIKNDVLTGIIMLRKAQSVAHRANPLLRTDDDF